MDSKELSRLTGRRLKEEREKHGLSHIALSDAIFERYGVRIAKDSLINYEVSEDHHTKAYKNNGMRVEYLRYLADFYEVSTDWLLGLSDVRTSVAEIKQVCNYTGLESDTVEMLHELNTVWNKPTFALMLINELLQFGRIYRTGKFAWRGAIVEAQRRKIEVRDAQKQKRRKPADMTWLEYSKTEEYKEEVQKTLDEKKKADEKLVEEACKPISEVSERIEIGAFDAAKLFQDRAISPLKSAVEHAYQKYVDKVTEVVFGDEYEEYLREHKRTPAVQGKPRKDK